MKLLLCSEFDVGYPTVGRVLGEWGVLGGRVLFIPTAAYGEGYDPDIAFITRCFQQMNLTMEIFDLRGQTPDALHNAVDRAQIIFVGGGNTFFLLEHMNRTGFRDVLADALAAGKIYIGSSAGSAVCCRDIQYVAAMDDPAQAPGLDNTKGLGYLDRALIPHLDHEFLGETAQAILRDYSGPCPALGLNDDQVVLIDDDGVHLL